MNNDYDWEKIDLLCAAVSDCLEDSKDTFERSLLRCLLVTIRNRQYRKANEIIHHVICDTHKTQGFQHKRYTYMYFREILPPRKYWKD